MARFWTNGWPVGTICIVKNFRGVNDSLRGKLVEIVKEKGWSDHFGYEGYFVDEVVNKATTPRWYAKEEWLEFRSYPLTLQNWCRNKVDLLMKIDPIVAATLAKEKEDGTEWPDYK